MKEKEKDISPTEVNELVLWIGDCIFPVKSSLCMQRFKWVVIAKAIKENLIMGATSKAGSNPAAMRTPKGYIELTEHGWDKYQLLKPQIENL